MASVFIFWLYFFFFNDPATTEIYTYCHTLSLHDALPILHGIIPFARHGGRRAVGQVTAGVEAHAHDRRAGLGQREHHRAVRLRPGMRLNVDETRSEEHTSELQSLMRISYAVFCLKKKKKNI